MLATFSVPAVVKFETVEEQPNTLHERLEVCHKRSMDKGKEFALKSADCDLDLNDLTASQLSSIARKKLGVDKKAVVNIHQLTLRIGDWSASLDRAHLPSYPVGEWVGKVAAAKTAIWIGWECDLGEYSTEDGVKRDLRAVKNVHIVRSLTIKGGKLFGVASFLSKDGNDVLKDARVSLQKKRRVQRRRICKGEVKPEVRMEPTWMHWKNLVGSEWHRVDVDGQLDDVDTAYSKFLKDKETEEKLPVSVKSVVGRFEEALGIQISALPGGAAAGAGSAGSGPGQGDAVDGSHVDFMRMVFREAHGNLHLIRRYEWPDDAERPSRPQTLLARIKLLEAELANREGTARAREEQSGEAGEESVGEYTGNLAQSAVHQSAAQRQHRNLVWLSIGVLALFLAVVVDIVLRCVNRDGTDDRRNRGDLTVISCTGDIELMAGCREMANKRDVE